MRRQSPRCQKPHRLAGSPTESCCPHVARSPPCLCQGGTGRRHVHSAHNPNGPEHLTTGSAYPYRGHITLMIANSAHHIPNWRALEGVAEGLGTSPTAQQRHLAGVVSEAAHAALMASAPQISPGLLKGWISARSRLHAQCKGPFCHVGTLVEQQRLLKAASCACSAHSSCSLAFLEASIVQKVFKDGRNAHKLSWSEHLLRCKAKEEYVQQPCF